MKLLSIKLNEASYGGYDYNETPHIAYRAVSDDLSKLKKVAKIWLEDNVSMKQVSVNFHEINERKIEHTDYLKIVLEKIDEALENIDTEYLEVRFWDSSNWSESTVEIEVTNVELI